MKLLVCVKEVPDIDVEMAIDASGTEISYGPYATFRMNVFDEYAVEEGVRIKERLPGTTLDVITLGPPRAAKVIERSIGMGADNGIHILTAGDDGKYETGSDAFQVASWLATYAKQQQYGKRSLSTKENSHQKRKAEQHTNRTKSAHHRVAKPFHVFDLRKQ